MEWIWFDSKWYISTSCRLSENSLCSGAGIGLVVVHHNVERLRGMTGWWIRAAGFYACVSLITTCPSVAAHSWKWFAKILREKTLTWYSLWVIGLYLALWFYLKTRRYVTQELFGTLLAFWSQIMRSAVGEVFMLFICWQSCKSVINNQKGLLRDPRSHTSFRIKETKKGTGHFFVCRSFSFVTTEVIKLSTA